MTEEEMRDKLFKEYKSYHNSGAKTLYCVIAFFILIFAFTFLCVLKCNATNYYVSSSGGNDGNAGTSTIAAWQTLSKINSSFSTFAAGDSIFLKRGDVFYGNINITKSGVSGNPIYIGAYGTGAMPVITGFTNIVSWTNLGSNIWQSTSAIGSLATCNMVMRSDSTNLPMGRTPNIGSYYTISSHSGTSWIRSSSINSTIHNWTGATIVGRFLNTLWNNMTVTSNSADTLKYSTSYANTPTDGYGFFMQNDASTLDVQDEWYYDVSTKKIKIYSTTSPSTYSAASVSDLIYGAANDYITINGIALIGASNDGINFQGTVNNLTVTNCYIRFCGNNGIESQTGASIHTITNNYITDVGRAGIFVVGAGGVSNVASNNYIRNCGMILGQDDYNLQANGIHMEGQATITYNTIVNSGSAGIMPYNLATTQYNYVDSSVLRLSDMGGIYASYHANGSTISFNIVRHSLGFTAGTTRTNGNAEGIYLDEGAEHFSVNHNTCEGNQEYGCKIHSTSSVSPSSDSNNVSNNLFYNNGVGQIIIQNTNGSVPLLNDTLMYNILFCTGSTQYTIYLQDQNNSPSTILKSDSSYFVQPFSAGQLTAYQSSSSTTNMNLSSWQTTTGGDAHTSLTPKTLTDTTGNVLFLYNATSSSKSFSVSNSYTDGKGVVNSTGTITLAAYTGYAGFKGSAIVISNGKKLYGNFKTH